MRSVILAAMLVTVLVGCGSNKPQPNLDQAILAHPNMPRSVQTQDVKWERIDTDNGTYVALPIKGFVNFMVFQEDVARYIGQLLNVTCYYRESLNEPVCQSVDAKADSNDNNVNE